MWETNEPKMNIRTKFAAKAQKSDNFSELCREFNISRKTGYKWLEIYEKDGPGGMGDASRRPKSHANSLTEEVICRIVLLRNAHPTWGARKLQEVYRRAHKEAPSESSVKRVLERCGLVKKRRTRGAKTTGNIIRTGIKAAAPNDVWTIDFKGYWYDANGKSNPFTVRDEFSRYVLELRHLPNGTGESVKSCMIRLFKEHGLPQAIRSDNGTPFACTRSVLGISKLSAWWLTLGIELERSRPGKPQDNGGHERMHADVMREIEGLAKSGNKALKQDPGARQASFDIWRKEFNDDRPHEAIGMRMPKEVYKPSTRLYDAEEFDIEYDGMERRSVQPEGSFKFEYNRYFVSTSLAGYDVGLKFVDGRYEVYFCQLLMGVLDPTAKIFEPILPPEKLSSRKRRYK